MMPRRSDRHIRSVQERISKELPLLRRLCRLFYCPVPEIVTHEKDYDMYTGQTNGYYRIWLTVRPGQRVSMRARLLHELAHHICWVRNPKIKKRQHDNEFWEMVTLLSVVVYDNARKYAWRTEYASGIRFAKARGILC